MQESCANAIAAATRKHEEEAKSSKKVAPSSPESTLQKKVTAILLKKNDDLRVKRKNAGIIILEWLNNNGKFLRNQEDALFYFYEEKKCLYELETEYWNAFLYGQTGVNPAGSDYRHIMEDCKKAALDAPKCPVVRVSAWDKQESVLRVSRFDGTVYRLNGKEIREESNGESFFFHDDPNWLSYEPNWKNKSKLEWLSPNWESNPKAQDLALKAWVLSTFFTELCPTRPLLVLLGEKGSTKSISMRRILQLLFGPDAQVSGLPDKQDGFTAAVAHAHVHVIDNLDKTTPWLQDKLARIATGTVDEYRRLYSQNQVGKVRYRVWLAFTARTPDTLRRDDLADRSVILRTERVKGAFVPEKEFLEHAQAIRNDWWGSMLQMLNLIVAAIRRGELPKQSSMRLADWECLCRLIAQVSGAEATWDEFVQIWEANRQDFLIDDVIVEYMEEWLKEPENRKKELSTREFYEELTPTTKPPSDWPQGVTGFGMRLSNLRDDLGKKFGLKWQEVRAGKIKYSFTNG